MKNGKGFLSSHTSIVAGFEEVVEEVELSPTWDDINKSSSTSSSLSHDSGISTDPSPDIFFTLVEETPGGGTHLITAPGHDGGEVIVERIYEIKDDICFAEGAVEIIKEEGKDDINFDDGEVPWLTKVKVEVDMDEEELVVKDTEPVEETEVQEEPEDEEEETVSIRVGKEPLDADTMSNRLRFLAYHCTECNINFVDEAQFRAHMEDHLIKLQNSCALCSAEFESKSDLQEHIKEHFTQFILHITVYRKEQHIPESSA